MSDQSFGLTGEAQRTVVDRIVESVTSAIEDGRLSAGQRLIARELTAELGVSRNALREAFRRLTAEGIVTMEPHRGASVRRMSLRDMRDLCDIRGSLEGLAARLAAERGVGVGAALTRQLQAQRRAVTAGDLVTYRNLNLQFHELIVTAAENDQLADLIARSQRQFGQFQFRRMLTPDGLRGSFDEHVAIAAAIKRRDGQEADRLMVQHVQSLYDYVSGLQETNFWLTSTTRPDRRPASTALGAVTND